MIPQEIGIATLNYDTTGNFIGGKFEPTMTVPVDKNLMDSFSGATCKDGEEAIKQQATNIFASWFQAMNEIELADQEKYEIGTEIVGECEKYEDGTIKSCTIKFTFKTR